LFTTTFGYARFTHTVYRRSGYRCHTFTHARLHTFGYYTPLHLRLRSHWFTLVTHFIHGCTYVVHFRLDRWLRLVTFTCHVCCVPVTVPHTTLVTVVTYVTLRYGWLRLDLLHVGGYVYHGCLLRSTFVYVCYVVVGYDLRLRWLLRCYHLQLRYGWTTICWLPTLRFPRCPRCWFTFGWFVTFVGWFTFTFGLLLICVTVTIYVTLLRLRCTLRLNDLLRTWYGLRLSWLRSTIYPTFVVVTFTLRCWLLRWTFTILRCYVTLLRLVAPVVTFHVYGLFTVGLTRYVWLRLRWCWRWVPFVYVVTRLRLRLWFVTFTRFDSPPCRLLRCGWLFLRLLLDSGYIWFTFYVYLHLRSRCYVCYLPHVHTFDYVTFDFTVYRWLVLPVTFTLPFVCYDFTFDFVTFTVVTLLLICCCYVGFAILPLLRLRLLRCYVVVVVVYVYVYVTFDFTFDFTLPRLRCRTLLLVGYYRSPPLHVYTRRLRSLVTVVHRTFTRYTRCVYVVGWFADFVTFTFTLLRSHVAGRCYVVRWFGYVAGPVYVHDLRLLRCCWLLLIRWFVTLFPFDFTLVVDCYDFLTFVVERYRYVDLIPRWFTFGYVTVTFVIYARYTFTRFTVTFTLLLYVPFTFPFGTLHTVSFIRLRLRLLHVHIYGFTGYVCYHVYVTFRTVTVYTHTFGFHLRLVDSVTPLPHVYGWLVTLHTTPLLRLRTLHVYVYVTFVTRLLRSHDLVPIPRCYTFARLDTHTLRYHTHVYTHTILPFVTLFTFWLHTRLRLHFTRLHTFTFYVHTRLIPTTRWFGWFPVTRYVYTFAFHTPICYVHVYAHGYVVYTRSHTLYGYDLLRYAVVPPFTVDLPFGYGLIYLPFTFTRSVCSLPTFLHVYTTIWLHGAFTVGYVWFGWLIWLRLRCYVYVPFTRCSRHTTLLVTFCTRCYHVYCLRTFPHTHVCYTLRLPLRLFPFPVVTHGCGLHTFTAVTVAHVHVYIYFTFTTWILLVVRYATPRSRWFTGLVICCRLVPVYRLTFTFTLFTRSICPGYVCFPRLPRSRWLDLRLVTDTPHVRLRLPLRSFYTRCWFTLRLRLFPGLHLHTRLRTFPSLFCHVHHTFVLIPCYHTFYILLRLLRVTFVCLRSVGCWFIYHIPFVAVVVDLDLRVGLIPRLFTLRLFSHLRLVPFTLRLLFVTFTLRLRLFVPVYIFVYVHTFTLRSHRGLRFGYAVTLVTRTVVYTFVWFSHTTLPHAYGYGYTRLHTARTTRFWFTVLYVRFSRFPRFTHVDFTFVPTFVSRSPTFTLPHTLLVTFTLRSFTVALLYVWFLHGWLRVWLPVWFTFVTFDVWVPVYGYHVCVAVRSFYRTTRLQFTFRYTHVHGWFTVYARRYTARLRSGSPRLRFLPHCGCYVYTHVAGYVYRTVVTRFHVAGLRLPVVTVVTRLGWLRWFYDFRFGYLRTRLVTGCYRLPHVYVYTTVTVYVWFYRLQFTFTRLRFRTFTGYTRLRLRFVGLPVTDLHVVTFDLPHGYVYYTGLFDFTFGSFVYTPDYAFTLYTFTVGYTLYDSTVTRSGYHRLRLLVPVLLRYHTPFTVVDVLRTFGLYGLPRSTRLSVTVYVPFAVCSLHTVVTTHYHHRFVYILPHVGYIRLPHFAGWCMVTFHGCLYRTLVGYAHTLPFTPVTTRLRLPDSGYRLRLIRLVTVTHYLHSGYLYRLRLRCLVGYVAFYGCVTFPRLRLVPRTTTHTHILVCVTRLPRLRSDSTFGCSLHVRLFGYVGWFPRFDSHVYVLHRLRGYTTRLRSTPHVGSRYVTLFDLRYGPTRLHSVAVCYGYVTVATFGRSSHITVVTAVPHTFTHTHAFTPRFCRLHCLRTFVYRSTTYGCVCLVTHVYVYGLRLIPVPDLVYTTVVTDGWLHTVTHTRLHVAVVTTFTLYYTHDFAAVHVLVPLRSYVPHTFHVGYSAHRSPHHTRFFPYITHHGRLYRLLPVYVVTFTLRTFGCHVWITGYLPFGLRLRFTVAVVGRSRFGRSTRWLVDLIYTVTRTFGLRVHLRLRFPFYGSHTFYTRLVTLSHGWFPVYTFTVAFLDTVVTGYYAHTFVTLHVYGRYGCRSRYTFVYVIYGSLHGYVRSVTFVVGSRLHYRSPDVPLVTLDVCTAFAVTFGYHYPFGFTVTPHVYAVTHHRTFTFRFTVTRSRTLHALRLLVTGLIYRLVGYVYVWFTVTTDHVTYTFYTRLLPLHTPVVGLHGYPRWLFFTVTATLLTTVTATLGLRYTRVPHLRFALLRLLIPHRIHTFVGCPPRSTRRWLLHFTRLRTRWLRSTVTVYVDSTVYTFGCSGLRFTVTIHCGCSTHTRCLHVPTGYTGCWTVGLTPADVDLRSRSRGCLYYTVYHTVATLRFTVVGLHTYGSYVDLHTPTRLRCSTVVPLHVCGLQFAFTFILSFTFVCCYVCVSSRWFHRCWFVRLVTLRSRLRCSLDFTVTVVTVVTHTAHRTRLLSTFVRYVRLLVGFTLHYRYMVTRLHTFTLRLITFWFTVDTFVHGYATRLPPTPVGYLPVVRSRLIPRTHIYGWLVCRLLPFWFTVGRLPRLRGYVPFLPHGWLVRLLRLRSLLVAAHCGCRSRSLPPRTFVGYHCVTARLRLRLRLFTRFTFTPRFTFTHRYCRITFTLHVVTVYVDFTAILPALHVYGYVTFTRLFVGRYTHAFTFGYVTHLLLRTFGYGYVYVWLRFTRLRLPVYTFTLRLDSVTRLFYRLLRWILRSRLFGYVLRWVTFGCGYYVCWLHVLRWFTRLRVCTFYTRSTHGFYVTARLFYHVYVPRWRLHLRLVWMVTFPPRARSTFTVTHHTLRCWLDVTVTVTYALFTPVGYTLPYTFYRSRLRSGYTIWFWLLFVHGSRLRVTPRLRRTVYGWFTRSPPRSVTGYHVHVDYTFPTPYRLRLLPPVYVPGCLFTTPTLRLIYYPTRFGYILPLRCRLLLVTLVYTRLLRYILRLVHTVTVCSTFTTPVRLRSLHHSVAFAFTRSAGYARYYTFGSLRLHLHLIFTVAVTFVGSLRSTVTVGYHTLHVLRLIWLLPTFCCYVTPFVVRFYVLRLFRFCFGYVSLHTFGSLLHTTPDVTTRLRLRLHTFVAHVVGLRSHTRFTFDLLRYITFTTFVPLRSTRWFVYGSRLPILIYVRLRLRLPFRLPRLRLFRVYRSTLHVYVTLLPRCWLLDLRFYVLPTVSGHLRWNVYDFVYVFTHYVPTPFVWLPHTFTLDVYGICWFTSPHSTHTHFVYFDLFPDLPHYVLHVRLFDLAFTFPFVPFTFTFLLHLRLLLRLHTFVCCWWLCRSRLRLRLIPTTFPVTRLLIYDLRLFPRLRLPVTRYSLRLLRCLRSHVYTHLHVPITVPRCTVVVGYTWCLLRFVRYVVWRYVVRWFVTTFTTFVDPLRCCSLRLVTLFVDLIYVPVWRSTFPFTLFVGLRCYTLRYTFPVCHGYVTLLRLIVTVTFICVVWTLRSTLRVTFPTFTLLLRSVCYVYTFTFPLFPRRCCYVTFVGVPVTVGCVCVWTFVVRCCCSPPHFSYTTVYGSFTHVYGCLRLRLGLVVTRSRVLPRLRLRWLLLRFGYLHVTIYVRTLLLLVTGDLLRCVWRFPTFTTVIYGLRCDTRSYRWFTRLRLHVPHVPTDFTHTLHGYVTVVTFDLFGRCHTPRLGVDSFTTFTFTLPFVCGCYPHTVICCWLFRWFDDVTFCVGWFAYVVVGVTVPFVDSRCSHVCWLRYVPVDFVTYLRTLLPLRCLPVVGCYVTICSRCPDWLRWLRLCCYGSVPHDYVPLVVVYVCVTLRWTFGVTFTLLFFVTLNVTILRTVTVLRWLDLLPTAFTDTALHGWFTTFVGWFRYVTVWWLLPFTAFWFTLRLCYVAPRVCGYVTRLVPHVYTLLHLLDSRCDLLIYTARCRLRLPAYGYLHVVDLFTHVCYARLFPVTLHTVPFTLHTHLVISIWLLFPFYTQFPLFTLLITFDGGVTFTLPLLYVTLPGDLRLLLIYDVVTTLLRCYDSPHVTVVTFTLLRYVVTICGVWFGAVVYLPIPVTTRCYVTVAITFALLLLIIRCCLPRLHLPLRYTLIVVGYILFRLRCYVDLHVCWLLIYVPRCSRYTFVDYGGYVYVTFPRCYGCVYVVTFYVTHVVRWFVVTLLRFTLRCDLRSLLDYVTTIYVTFTFVTIWLPVTFVYTVYTLRFPLHSFTLLVTTCCCCRLVIYYDLFVHTFYIRLTVVVTLLLLFPLLLLHSDVRCCCSRCYVVDLLIAIRVDCWFGRYVYVYVVVVTRCYHVYGVVVGVTLRLPILRCCYTLRCSLFVVDCYVWFVIPCWVGWFWWFICSVYVMILRILLRCCCCYALIVTLHDLRYALRPIYTFTVPVRLICYGYHDFSRYTRCCYWFTGCYVRVTITLPGCLRSHVRLLPHYTHDVGRFPRCSRCTGCWLRSLPFVGCYVYTDLHTLYVYTHGHLRYVTLTFTFVLRSHSFVVTVCYVAYVAFFGSTFGYVPVYGWFHRLRLRLPHRYTLLRSLPIFRVPRLTLLQVDLHLLHLLRLIPRLLHTFCGCYVYRLITGLRLQLPGFCSRWFPLDSHTLRSGLLLVTFTLFARLRSIYLYVHALRFTLRLRLRSFVWILPLLPTLLRCSRLFDCCCLVVTIPRLLFVRCYDLLRLLLLLHWFYVCWWLRWLRLRCVDLRLICCCCSIPVVVVVVGDLLLHLLLFTLLLLRCCCCYVDLFPLRWRCYVTLRCVTLRYGCGSHVYYRLHLRLLRFTRCSGYLYTFDLRPDYVYTFTLLITGCYIYVVTFYVVDLIEFCYGWFVDLFGWFPLLVTLVLLLIYSRLLLDYTDVTTRFVGLRYDYVVPHVTLLLLAIYVVLHGYVYVRLHVELRYGVDVGLRWFDLLIYVVPRCVVDFPLRYVDLLLLRCWLLLVVTLRLIVVTLRWFVVVTFDLRCYVTLRCDLRYVVVVAIYSLLRFTLLLVGCAPRWLLLICWWCWFGLHTFTPRLRWFVDVYVCTHNFGCLRCYICPLPIYVVTHRLRFTCGWLPFPVCVYVYVCSHLIVTLSVVPGCSHHTTPLRCYVPRLLITIYVPRLLLLVTVDSHTFVVYVYTAHIHLPTFALLDVPLLDLRLRLIGLRFALHSLLRFTPFTLHSVTLRLPPHTRLRSPRSPHVTLVTRLRLFTLVTFATPRLFLLRLLRYVTFTLRLRCRRYGCCHTFGVGCSPRLRLICVPVGYTFPVATFPFGYVYGLRWLVTTRYTLPALHTHGRLYVVHPRCSYTHGYVPLPTVTYVWLRSVVVTHLRLFTFTFHTRLRPRYVGLLFTFVGWFPVWFGFTFTHLVVGWLIRSPVVPVVDYGCYVTFVGYGYVTVTPCVWLCMCMYVCIYYVYVAL